MVRVGIIGTGWGVNVQVPIFRAAGLEVTAIYSRDKAKAQSICEKLKIPHAFDSIGDLVGCPDVDLVSVVSPTHLHAEHSLAALRAGKHVLTDKPAGASVAEVEAMAKEARERPKQVAIIDHEVRFTKAAQAARKAVAEDKAIGELRHVDLQFMLQFGHFGRRHSWWNEQEKGGGVMGAIGVHAIDLLHFTTGQKISTVNGMLETFVKEKPNRDGGMVPCTAEEYISTQIRTEGGAVGTFSISGVTHTRQSRVIHFVGTSGSALFDIDKCSLTVSDAKGKTVSQVADDKSVYNDAFPLGTFNLASGIKALIEGGDAAALGAACTFEDGLYNQRVIAAVQKSSVAGAWSRL
mmetsp:Transcript_32282/g.72857  ORF Transcript_32282/g.72857 Transcript_32282/m.72857 type:complete len:350 (+) Transcript_32282:75-1124(+)